MADKGEIPIRVCDDCFLCQPAATNYCSECGAPSERQQKKILREIHPHTDAERLDFLEAAIKNHGMAHFDAVGARGCWMELFTTRSGRTKRMPNVRDAIDKAIQLAREKGKYNG